MRFLLFFKVLVCLFLILACTGGDSEMNLSSPLQVSPTVFTKLESLKTQDKFGEDASSFYPGATSEPMRLKLNGLMNKSIDEIIPILKDRPTKARILEQYKAGLSRFDGLNLDTEDREQVCTYYDRIREVIGLDSTHGLLNQWLYGALGKELKIE